MNLFYFIGIKGTGMAALACMLHDLGHEVMGSDLQKHFFTEDPLRERGIVILSFDAKNIPDHSTVIIGNAFLEDFEEVKAARNNPTVTCFRYHEYLGELMKGYHSVCVAGSHGKTTTTGMLSCMLNHWMPTGYLIGDGTGKIHSDSENIVVEACEFRRHFLAYSPDYAIITNVEIDHVDYFTSEEDYSLAYEQFAENVKKALVVFGDDLKARSLDLKGKKCWYYGEGKENDVVAENIVETSTGMSFDVLIHNQLFGHFDLPFVGHHLLWNSLGVITVGYLMGLNAKQIEESLSLFTGAKRRFSVEVHGENIFVDDYAHHPTEVSVTVDTARKRFPDKKLVAIFKPHRASRVLYFAEQFASALRKADVVYLCDFTSIDDKQDGTDIDITYLSKMIEGSFILSEDDEGAKILAKEEPCVYLFMSSKDIYELAEKVKRFQNY
ncbi:MAG: UDP-N-acetylmuramate--L-alanine ligase [Erysipelotrichaceae bacterium]|nr:UDP-N-acetylmuramate--L-alanine ligase [Erysipelotrichaceae bacterium]